MCPPPGSLPTSQRIEVGGESKTPPRSPPLKPRDVSQQSGLLRQWLDCILGFGGPSPIPIQHPGCDTLASSDNNVKTRHGAAVGLLESMPPVLYQLPGEPGAGACLNRLSQLPGGSPPGSCEADLCAVSQTHAGRLTACLGRSQPLRLNQSHLRCSAGPGRGPGWLKVPLWSPFQIGILHPVTHPVTHRQAQEQNVFEGISRLGFIWCPLMFSPEQVNAPRCTGTSSRCTGASAVATCSAARSPRVGPVARR